MLAPMYTSGSSGHAGEAVGSWDQLRVKQWPWRELRAAAFLWRYSTGYLRRGQEMRADNTTTSSAQPKNPEFQTSADLQISPNTESGLFLSPKTSPKLGADVPKLPLFSVCSAQKNPPTKAPPGQSRPIVIPGVPRRHPRRWSQRRPHQKGKSKRPNGPRHHSGPTCTAPRAPRWFWCTTCFLRQTWGVFYGEPMWNLRWEKGWIDIRSCHFSVFRMSQDDMGNDDVKWWNMGMFSFEHGDTWRKITTTKELQQAPWIHEMLGCKLKSY